MEYQRRFNIDFLLTIIILSLLIVVFFATTISYINNTNNEKYTPITFTVCEYTKNDCSLAETSCSCGNFTYNTFDPNLFARPSINPDTSCYDKYSEFCLQYMFILVDKSVNIKTRLGDYTNTLGVYGTIIILGSCMITLMCYSHHQHLYVDVLVRKDKFKQSTTSFVCTFCLKEHPAGTEQYNCLTQNCTVKICKERFELREKDTDKCPECKTNYKL